MADEGVEYTRRVHEYWRERLAEITYKAFMVTTLAAVVTAFVSLVMGTLLVPVGLIVAAVVLRIASSVIDNHPVPAPYPSRTSPS